MQLKIKISTIFLAFVIMVSCYNNAYSYINPNSKEKSKDLKDSLLRTAYGDYDFQQNTVSNVSFYLTNYGIFGNNILTNTGGTYWPRGSLNQYIFGGGLWFAAMKKKYDSCYSDSCYRKMVEISYNPNSGSSWFVPGCIEDGDLLISDSSKKYRLYFSTDFRNDGIPSKKTDGPNWPVWDSDSNRTLKNDRYFGSFVYEQDLRTKTFQPKGPAFISGEDIYSTFKDTELDRFEGGVGVRQNLGYPLRLQVENRIYTWGWGDYANIVFLSYSVINKSTDTLINCYVGPVVDADIATYQNSSSGAGNDRCMYYKTDPSLNLGIQWTNGDRGEKGRGFGYLGFTFLESPAVNTCEKPFDSSFKVTNIDIKGNITYTDQLVSFCKQCITSHDSSWYQLDTLQNYLKTGDSTVKDSHGNDSVVTKNTKRDSTICDEYSYFPQSKIYYPSVLKANTNGGVDTTYAYFSQGIPESIRKNKASYPYNQQIGMTAFRNWTIQEDWSTDGARYNAMSTPQFDGDLSAADKRIMMSTGPFIFAPKDTARLVMAFVFSRTAVRTEADEKEDNLAELIRMVKFAHEVYDSNYAAPKPPDRSVFLNWKPLNNGIYVHWDSTSEVSWDIREKERGLDFMGYKLYRARRNNLDSFNVDNIDNASKTGGPFGWKQVYTTELLTPFEKSWRRAGTDQTNKLMPFIDSLQIVGPYINPQGVIDPNSIVVMRVGRGIRLTPDSLKSAGNAVLRIDTLWDPSNYWYPGMYPLGVTLPDYWKQLLIKDVWGGDFSSSITNWVNSTSTNPTTNKTNLVDAGMNVKIQKFMPVISYIDTGYYMSPWGKFYKEQYEKDIKEHGDTLPIRYDPFHKLDTNGKPVNTNKRFWDTLFIGRIVLSTSVPYNPLLWRRTTVPYDTIYQKNNIDRQKYYGDTICVDKFGYYSYLDGKNMKVMDVMVKRKFSEMMSDTNHIHEVLDSVYSFIQNKKVIEYDFNEWLDSAYVRDSLIVPQMKSWSNNRTFYDIGDDDQSGDIVSTGDPTTTEKLINNIDYFYKILAYDEGDFIQVTPQKLNDAQDKLPNFLTTYPRSAVVSNDISFEVTSMDTAKLGGLYNFKMFSIDAERARQIFTSDTSSDEFELKFRPYWYSSSFGSINHDKNSNLFPVNYGFYGTEMILTDLTKNKILYDNASYLATTGIYTENAASWYSCPPDSIIYDAVLQKRLTFHTAFNKEKKVGAGLFTTGTMDAPSYTYNFESNSPGYGNLGFSYNYVLEQMGGVLRPDSATTQVVINHDKSPINYIPYHVTLAYGKDPTISTAPQIKDSTSVYSTMEIRMRWFGIVFPTNLNINQEEPYGWSNYVYKSFNNGHGEFLVTFRSPDDTKGEGNGFEDLDLAWGTTTSSKRNTFHVSYLVIDVQNMSKVEFTDNTGKVITVQYPGKMAHCFIDTSYGMPSPIPYNLGLNADSLIGKYNLSARGWINGRSIYKTSSIDMMKAIYARPAKIFSQYAIQTDIECAVGTQGRYYLSGYSTNGQDTIDFTHKIIIGGVQFVIDHYNRGLLAPKQTTGISAKDAFPTLVNGGPDTNFRPLKDGYSYKYGASYDYQPGDQLKLVISGGAFGFPLPGATVRFKIVKPVDSLNYTSSVLDKIRIVPNPYYITHEGEQSAYDAQLYFTRLPKKCTIDIYTVNGDLVKSINHDESSYDPVKEAVEVWNLLSYNKQRVQSQTLVAIISTNNGEQTVKPFSIVVGGFRIISE